MLRFFKYTFNCKNQCGATMLEYAMLAALVSVVSIGAISSIGQSAETSFTRIAEEMKTATDAPTGCTGIFCN